MSQPTLAFLPLARQTFDMELARQVTALARANLQSVGFSIIGPNHPITDLASAQSIAADLQQTSYDLLVIFQATFADSSLVTTLA